jgi:hypothetical protein
MIKELIDNEEFISLFNIRGRKISRTMIISGEVDREQDNVVLIIEHVDCSSGRTKCNAFTFEFNPKSNRLDICKRTLYNTRDTSYGWAVTNTDSYPKKVKQAIINYFRCFGINVYSR